MDKRATPEGRRHSGLPMENIEQDSMEGAVHSLQQANVLIDKLQARVIELELQNQELRKTHDAMGDYNAMLAEMYEHSPAGHVVLDKNGVIVRANHTAGQLLDMDPRRMAKKPFHVYVMRETLNDYRAHCREAILTRQRVRCDALLRPRDGEPFRARLETIGMVDPQLQELTCHTAFYDVTDFKQVEEALRDELAARAQVELELRNYTDLLGAQQATATSQEVDAVVGELVARTAHDINNALAGIKNVFLLLKGVIPQEHQYFKYLPLVDDEIRSITRAIRRLNGQNNGTEG